jgi:RNA recognition motif-containing protein
LSWDVAWQDLKDHMREAGEVVHAEIIRDANGRSKGCGIVEFASEDDAQNAISTLTDTELKGRMIFIREDRETGNQGGMGGGNAAGRGHQNTSVYVWNLSPETSWQDLKDHMRRAGNVDSASVLTNSQGESLCCGVVVYQKPQEAIRAIRELQNSELKGNPIYVREDRAQNQGGGRGFARGSGGRSGSGRGRSGRGGGRGGRGGRGDESGTQLFVSNLSSATTWKELKDHFRQCGEVAHAEVKSNPQGQSKGFGTVSFSTREEAEEAINQMNGSELQGSQLEVRFDQRTR